MLPLHTRRRAALAASVIALLAAGCAGTPERADVAGLGAPPRRAWSFEGTGQSGGVKYSATFVKDHEGIFETDLIEDERIVPIALKVGLDRTTSIDAKVAGNTVYLLYLPDGTACPSVPPEEIQRKSRKVHGRIQDRALRRDFLEVYERAPVGFVYFRLPEYTAYSSDANTVTFGKKDRQRTVDLSRSLVAFQLNVDGVDQTLYVGLNSDNWSRISR